MLYTERLHFYRRYRMRGIQNLIFYGLPQYPHYYPELLNLLSDIDGSCTALYSLFDVYQLQGIVGDERAAIMLKSAKNTHMFC